MRKHRIRFLISFVTGIMLVLVLSGRLFIDFPVAPLLDPFVGFVQNEDDGLLNAARMEFDRQGLHGPVQIFFDARKVPHIDATNREDVYYAQGFVTAALRLWQMDFLSYSAAGRLSEIYGDKALQYDRNQRRTGLPQAAKASLALIETDTLTSKMLTAYTKGVNAYIQRLDYKSLPLEFKIFNYRPEPWSNLKTVLVMKQMAALLCGYEEDAVMSRMLVALGEEKFNLLFPDFPSHMAPPLSDTVAITGGHPAFLKKPAYLDSSFLSMDSEVAKSAFNPAVGSNSWVVSGKKTRSGYPILCSDPHLPLSLPSVWLEVQLIAPGLNVYGVSIPGIPSVLMGFNERIAWGTTNGSADTRDWYKLNMDKDHRSYELDGKWIDMRRTVEAIKVKGQPVFHDTIYHTVHGPVAYDDKFPGINPAIRDHALKWALHQPSNELRTFLQLSTAGTYTDFKAALQTYSSPVQNFTFAGRDNDIAVHHQGRIAVKWQGQGKFILDGTESSCLYSEYIPADSLPYLYNPSCNFVIAANQHPVNAGYPYYTNGYYKQTRAKRIRQLLLRHNEWDIAKMRTMQLDNINVFAVDALPVWMKTMDSSSIAGREKDLLKQLHAWTGAFDASDELAILFDLWRQNIRNYTWDELKNYSFGARLPDDYILLEMIRCEPHNDFFDRQHTVAKENAAGIIRKAFDSASIRYSEIKRKGNSQWSAKNKISINSISSIGQFSRLNIPSAGCAESINSITNNTGPSWRMVVELGPRPKAFGIYPAGQSGNGTGRYFDNFIDDWSKGSYYPLLFFTSVNEAKANSRAVWFFK